MTDQLYLVRKEKWVQRKSSTWLYDYMNSCPSSWLVVHLKINHGFWLMNWLANYVMSILRFPVHKIYIAWLDFFKSSPFHWLASISFLWALNLIIMFLLQHFFPSTCSAQQPSIDWLFNLLNALQAFFLIPVFSCNWALKYCSCFTTTAGSFTLVSNSPVLVFLLEQVFQFCRLVHKHGLHL